jgi:hypothetical protein
VVLARVENLIARIHSPKKYFECGEIGHISTNCKNKDEGNSSKKKLFKKYNKKKNDKACYVEWDSDVSSDFDFDDDDEGDEKPSKKGLAALPSRKLHLFLTHLIISWHKVNRWYAKLMNSPMMILLRW